MKIATVNDVESLRGEIFHMILFAMAWSLIGEYLLNFRDYSAGVILTLAGAVVLALYSIRLYDLESELEDKGRIVMLSNRADLHWGRSYALILFFEGIAILISWSILLKYGHDEWVVPSFALIAGLHFFPLARVMRLNSYYLLGAWICVVAAVCYWLFMSGRLEDRLANAIIAYACAAGALVDGAVIAFRAHRELKR